jgi:hypothetical protein
MRIIKSMHLNTGRQVILYENSGWNLKLRLIIDYWKNAYSNVVHSFAGFHVSPLHPETEVLDRKQVFGVLVKVPYSTISDIILWR